MPFSAAAIASSDFMTGRRPVPFPAGIELIAQRFTINLAAADVAVSQIGAVGILPAGCVPVAYEVDAAILDSGTALAYSLGVMNLAGFNAAGAVSAGQAADALMSTLAADGGAAWSTALTVGRTAAGAASSLTNRAIKSVTARSVDRNIGISVTTGAGTAVAGEFAITLYYRAN